MASMKALQSNKLSRHTTRQALVRVDMGLFAVSLPQNDPSALERAVTMVQTWLQHPSPVFSENFREVLATPKLVPFLLSNLDDVAFGQFQRLILHLFPEESLEDLKNSIAYRLLVYLDEFWGTTNLPFEDVNKGISQCSNTVRRCTPALESMLRSKVSLLSGTSAVELPKAAFDALGCSVPRNNHDLRKVGGMILRDLKRVLQHYLKLVREGSLREILQLAYFGTIENPHEVTREQVPSAVDYSVLSGRKGAMIFGNTSGFGEWQILVSSRLVRNLREARKHKKLFHAIVNKIRELSNGNLAGDQYEVIYESALVPIYSARISKHCTVIYHYETRYDESSPKCIRVFGIYATASLDRKFWNEVGIELAARALSSQGVTSPVTSVTVENRDKIRALVLMDQFVTMSQSVVDAILNSQELAQRFQLSSQETEVVKHSGSCYVYGRSGTGKTTVILHKMLNIEASWLEHYEMLDSEKPRQIFVARSQFLADKVRQSFGRAFESHILGEQAEVRHDTLQHHLVDNDEEAQLASDLPERFGQLTDEHFPLFISYDRLCSLLEVEFGVCFTPRWGSRIGYLKRPAPLSYETFVGVYWSRFPGRLVKDLDPHSVYSEFIGVIEGSEDALSFQSGSLTQEAYCQLSSRRYSAFADVRERIYKLYQKYVAKKKELGQYDMADRTHAIIRALPKQASDLTCAVDFLYVDEAQDLLLIDAFLLRSLCRNPNGFLWAGDTAQTISAGSSFTFAELKSFLYRIKEKQKQMQSKTLRQINPEVFKLNINFRSYGGIVNCSQTVLDVLNFYWSDSIDQVPPETGAKSGSLPVCLLPREDRAIDLETLFTKSNALIEFGAEQCILVRTETARANLRSLVGDSVLIMTLIESKGLEFNDVILYNIFNDSTGTESQWRMLLSAFSTGHKWIPGDPSPYGFQAPAIVMRGELRHLYVGITRARHKLLIVDSSDKVLPLQRLWLDRGQVSFVEDWVDLSKFAYGSSKEEWAKAGLQFFHKRLYYHARQAYKAAGMEHQARVALAFQLQQEAQLKPVGKDDSGKGCSRFAAYKKAADAFLQVAPCDEVYANSYYCNAAACLLEVPTEKVQAAETYILGKDYTSAVLLYKKWGMFDEAVERTFTFEGNISADVVQSVRYTASLSYLCKNDVSKLEAQKLFSSKESILAFIEIHGLSTAYIPFLRHCQRWADVIKEFLNLGRIQEATSIYKSTCGSLGSDARQQVLSCVLRSFRRTLLVNMSGLNHVKTTNSVVLGALVKMANLVMADVDTNILPHEDRFELDLVLKLVKGDDDEPIYPPYGARLPVLLAISYFQRSLKITHMRRKPAGVNLIATWLGALFRYASILRVVELDRDPYTNPLVQELVGFEALSHHSYRISQTSPMQQLLTEKKISFDLKQESGDVVAKHVMRKYKLVEKLLIQTLQQQIVDINKKVMRSGAIQGRSACGEPLFGRLRLALQCILMNDSLRGQKIRTSPHTFAETKLDWLCQLFSIVTGPKHNPSLEIINCLKDKQATGDVQRASAVVDIWIGEASRLLSSSPSAAVISYMLQLTTLSRVLNGRDLPYTLLPLLYAPLPVLYAPLPVLYASRPPLRRANPRVDIRRYLHIGNIMSGSDGCSLYAGVLYFMSILRHSHPFDVGTMCFLVEFLCTSFSFVSRYHNGGLVNSLVFPASCLQLALKDENQCQEYDICALELFLAQITPLLKEILIPSPGFFFYSEQPLRSDEPDRHVLIFRICQAVCTVGYNIDDESVRSQIVCTIKELNGLMERFPNLYNHYAAANTWLELVNALAQSPDLLEVVPAQDADVNHPIVYHVRSWGARMAADNTDESVNAGLDGIDGDGEELAPSSGSQVGTASATTTKESAAGDVPASSQPGIAPSATTTESAATNRNVPASGQPGTASAAVSPESAARNTAAPASSEHHARASIAPRAAPYTQAVKTRRPLTAEDLSERILFRRLRDALASDIRPSTMYGDEHHHAAARRIQWVVRRKLLWYQTNHRWVLSDTPLAVFRTRYLNEFLSAARDADWTGCTQQRAVFLGLLPPLLACLEAIRNELQLVRDKAGQRLLLAKPEDLEAEGRKVMAIGEYVLEAVRLQDVLKPESSLHNMGAVMRELREHLTAVDTLLGKLPEQVSAGVREELVPVRKGILKVTKARLFIRNRTQ